MAKNPPPGDNHRKGMGAVPVAKIRCKLCDPVADYTIRVKQKLGARSLADLIRLGITTGMARKNVLSLDAVPRLE